MDAIPMSDDDITKEFLNDVLKGFKQIIKVNFFLSHYYAME